MRCASCNSNLISEDRFTQFKCPSCLEGTIVRCDKCRLRSTSYACSRCGFRGP